MDKYDRISEMLKQPNPRDEVPDEQLRCRFWKTKEYREKAHIGTDGFEKMIIAMHSLLTDIRAAMYENTGFQLVMTYDEKARNMDYFFTLTGTDRPSELSNENKLNGSVLYRKFKEAGLLDNNQE
ncbi:MAG: hypothetical protein IJT16_11545 [Lachnospiraceae bacterium]|nr:hypothetical protein [Lachnospiraceae bacterium]